MASSVRLLVCLAAAHAFGPPTRRRLPQTKRRADGEKTGLDAIDELLPRFRRDAGAVDLPKEEETSTEGATMGTVNDKLLAEIEEAKKGFRVEAPQVDEREDVDISDVNPVQSVLSGVAALATAYVFWLAVGFAAESFAEHPVDSEIYAIQRISTPLFDDLCVAGTVTADRVSGLKIGYRRGNKLSGIYDRGDWLVRFDTVGPALEAGLAPTIVVDRPVIQQILVKHGFPEGTVRRFIMDDQMRNNQRCRFLRFSSSRCQASCSV